MRRKEKGPRVVRLEPGVDGDMLARLGPAGANAAIRRQRLVRLGMAVRPPRTAPVKLGQRWHSRDRNHSGGGRPFTVIGFAGERVIVRHRGGRQSQLAVRTFIGARARYALCR